MHVSLVCSSGKDKMLKYWDMDRFEMLLELPGHHGEVWGLAVSTYGDFVVTGESWGAQLCLAGSCTAYMYNESSASFRPGSHVV
jgi:WD40 repeat protein